MYYLYRITNLLNNKVYIGQSNKEKDRWRQYKYFGRNPEKTGQYIHRAMAKYGASNFIYEVIAMCATEEYANEAETILIAQYNSRDKQFGYNLAPGGDSPWNRGLPTEQQPMYGKHHSEESKEKISQGNIGKICFPHTDEWKQHMSSIMKGRQLSEDRKQKISDASKNREFTEEQKEKLRVLHLGKKHTQTSKDKISAASIGKPKSEQMRQNLSKSKGGSNNNFATLTWDIVLKIREDYNNGLFTQKQLAAKYNTTDSNICNIVNYKTWRLYNFCV